MEGLWYFTEANVTLDALHDNIKEAGFKTIKHKQDIEWLEVFSNAKDDPGNIWVFETISELNVLDQSEDDERLLIQSCHANTYFLVQYYLNNLCQLASLFHKIMQSFGGYVLGSEDRIHDITTILQIKAVSALDDSVLIDCGQC